MVTPTAGPGKPRSTRFVPEADNCLDTPNPDQLDTDGVGDARQACEHGHLCK